MKVFDSHCNDIKKFTQLRIVGNEQNMWAMMLSAWSTFRVMDKLRKIKTRKATKVFNIFIPI